MSAAAKFREAMHKEPVVVFSCIIGAVGLLLPLVGSPIKSAFDTATPKNPPPVKQLLGKDKS